jgi:type VI secretion system protein VasJ
MGAQGLMKDPSDEIETTASASAPALGGEGGLSQSDWVGSLLAPIGDQGVGEDPRYSDRFMAVKTEIDRLSGNDFGTIARLSEEILAHEGKDLRIAGYLVLGTLRTQGLTRFCEVIEFYAALLDQYWDACFPRSEAGRVQAYRWLANDRIEAALAELAAASAGDADVMTRVERAVSGLCAAASRRMGQEGRWTGLEEWARTFAANNALNDVQVSVGQSEGLAGAASKEVFAVATESDALLQLRKIADYYLTQKERAKALAIMYSYRWSGLVSPPQEGGRTRLPAPRAGAMAEIRALKAQGASHESVLDACLSAFEEPGGQWNLDIQKAAHEALSGLNDAAALSVLEAHLRSLLTRCADAEHLRYEDGTAFADEATREWLGSFLATAPADAAPTESGVADKALKETIKRAAKVAVDQNLKAGLALLEDLPDRAGRQKFLKSLGHVRLCIKTKNLDMALAIIKSLEGQMEALNLAAWEPALALDVWRAHAHVVKLLIADAQPSGKTDLTERLAEIMAAVCRVDLQEAARMKRNIKMKGVLL